jgi:hypothetical protein
MFQVFWRYVASILYGYCKSRSGYNICCNGCTHMLQEFVSNVSSDVRCKHVYLDVAYIFTRMVKVFYLDVAYDRNVFLSVFANVSDTCFKCFFCLLYVASVVCECFKSRSGIAHEIRVGSRRGHEQSPRGRHSSAWAPHGHARCGRATSGHHRPMHGRTKTDRSRRRPDVRGLAALSAGQ